MKLTKEQIERFEKEWEKIKDDLDKKYYLKNKIEEYHEERAEEDRQNTRTLTQKEIAEILENIKN